MSFFILLLLLKTRFASYYFYPFSWMGNSNCSDLPYVFFKFIKHLIMIRGSPICKCKKTANDVLHCSSSPYAPNLNEMPLLVFAVWDFSGISGSQIGCLNRNNIVAEKVKWNIRSKCIAVTWGDFMYHRSLWLAPKQSNINQNMTHRHYL